MVKMLLLATFFPPVENGNGDFNVVAEILKTLVDFIDLGGIYFIINRTVGKPELKSKLDELNAFLNYENSIENFPVSILYYKKVH